MPTPTSHQRLADKQGVSDEDLALLALARAVRDTGYAFVTPTPLTHARVNARPQNAWARTLRDVFGWSRPFAGDVVPPPMMALMRAAGVLDTHPGGWRCAIRLSTLGDALFVHSAYPTTASDAVFFGPDTYRFARAIRAALSARTAPVRRAVDIGCGAGPGGLLIADAYPEAAVFLGDINDRALHFARVNAALAERDNVEVGRSDLLAGVEGTFDLIVSNPPYLVDPMARAYRHGGGAFGEGLSVAILRAAMARLAPGGTLLIYTGSAIVEGVDAFRRAAASALSGTPFSWACVEVDPDVFGEELDAGPYIEADRIAAVALTVCKES